MKQRGHLSNPPGGLVARMVRRLAITAVLGLSGLSAVAMSPQAASAATTNPSPPFTQCPHVGRDTSCGILVIINPSGSPTILADPSQGPYEGVEDTLVGVVNNSSVTINSLPFSGPVGTFAFEEDGICNPNNNQTSFSPGANCSGNTTDNTGYGGPLGSFSNISGDQSSGTVNFQGGLTPGASTFFSLEGAVTSSSLTINLISGAGTAVSATEASTFTGQVATFSDTSTTDQASAFTATIGYGDGTPSSTGTVTGSAGSFAVNGTHTYADEGPYTVTTTIVGPNNTIKLTSAATVAEADVLTGHSLSMPPAVIGQSVTGPVATFTDTNTANAASDFTATINYGDGSPTTAGTVSGGGGTFTVSGTHTYNSIGFLPVTVTLTDDGSGTATATVVSTALDVCGAASTITGSHPGSVQASGVECIINAQVGGSVNAAPGTSLLVLNSSIAGSLGSHSAQTIQVCASSLQGGSDTLVATLGVVLIGDAGDDAGSACGSNTIKGSLPILNSTGPVEVGGNDINGSLVLMNTTGSGITVETRPELEANVIQGSLSCSGNTPAPTNDGRANTDVRSTGQCSGL